MRDDHYIGRRCHIVPSSTKCTRRDLRSNARLQENRPFEHGESSGECFELTLLTASREAPCAEHRRFRPHFGRNHKLQKPKGLPCTGLGTRERRSKAPSRRPRGSSLRESFAGVTVSPGCSPEQPAPTGPPAGDGLEQTPRRTSSTPLATALTQSQRSLPYMPCGNKLSNSMKQFIQSMRPLFQLIRAERCRIDRLTG